MKIRIGSSVEVLEIEDDTRSAVEKRLTFKNPALKTAYFMPKKVRRFIPKTVQLHREEGGNLVIPRGAVGILQELARATRVPLEVDSQVVTLGPKAVGRSLDRLGTATLRPYQLEAVKTAVAKVQGLILVPCGGGKTTIGAAFALHSGESTIVGVHKVEIGDQWVEALVKMGATPRRIYSSDKPDYSPLYPGEIAIVGLRKDINEPAFFASAGALIIDEVHHTPCNTFARFIAKSAARFRIGLTATLYRSDGQEFVVENIFGPILFQISALELIALGYLQRPTIIPVDIEGDPGPEHYRYSVTCPCGIKRSLAYPAEVEAEIKTPSTCQGSKKKPCGQELGANYIDKVVDWGALQNDGAEDPRRLGVIEALSVAAFAARRRSLILSPRDDGAMAVLSLLRRNAIPSSYASGASSKHERKVAVRALRKGTVACLTATQIADEGLDVPELDMLINGAEGKSPALALQRAGRTARLGGQPPLVFELIGRSAPAKAQWRARRKAYVEEYGPASCPFNDPVDIRTAVVRLTPSGPVPPR